MGFTFVLVAVVLATVESVDRIKLGTTPSPQKNFDVDRYMGDWYMQARLPPCSWVGSWDFTNCISQYSKHPGGTVHLKGTWRSKNGCATATFVLTPDSQHGCYTLKDPIGDVLSGKNVIVATDYDGFAAEWGCSKYSTDGTCADPYVGVRTRKRDPSPRTWKIIEAILKYYWNLGLTEMVRDIHDQHACVQFGAPPSPYGGPGGADHLRKSY